MVGITRSKVIYRQTVFTQKVLRTEVLRTEGFTHIFFTYRCFTHRCLYTNTKCTQRGFASLLDHLPFVFPLKYCVCIYIYIVFPLRHDILLYINISFYYYELVVNICCCYL